MTTTKPTDGAGRRLPSWPWILIPALAVAGAGCTSSGTSTTTSAAATGSASACAVTSVASEVLPSVVTIKASGAAGAGTGSGEVIKSDGYILTNNHVISPAAAAEIGRAHV